VSKDLASTYPEVRRRLECWAGYDVLADVLRQFEDVDVFLAGGVIRNSVLGTVAPDKDFDFFLQGASAARAVQAFSGKGRLAKTPFGSARWHPAGDGECYADLIRVEEFGTGLWPCEDITDVLNQFDFTASAIAFDIRTGCAFNPQNGLRDLGRRIMRMIRFDFPEQPFAPGAELTMTAILWFRVLHYACVLEFGIEPLTLAWLRDRRHYRRHADLFADTFFEPSWGYLDRL